MRTYIYIDNTYYYYKVAIDINNLEIKFIFINFYFSCRKLYSICEKDCCIF